ncbi:MAG: YgjV family protein [Calditrichia bacterium]
MIDLLGYIGIVMNFLWPLFRKRAVMLIVQTIGALFFVAHFFSLGAKTGALMALIAAAQAVLAIPLESKPEFRKIYLLTLPVIAIMVAISWSGWPSVFCAIAMIIISIGRYQTNVMQFRLYLIVAEFFWIAHNILVGSIPGLVSDAVTLTSGISMYFRERRVM